MLDRCWLLALVLCSAHALPPGVGFNRPPLFGPSPYPPRPPYPGPPQYQQQHRRTDACPQGFSCVTAANCIVQCPLGWVSLDTGSCYQAGPPNLHDWQSAQTLCSSRAAELPLLEDGAELRALAQFGDSWTAARWQPASSSWIWQPTGAAVDFARLKVATPAPGSSDLGCLLLTTGTPARLEPRSCTEQQNSYVCESGSSSIARCSDNSRRCCAVDVDYYPDPPGCFVDNLGTRCGQRVRDGYFPVLDGESLVRVSSSALGWQAARDLCQQDGGDLAVVMSQRLHDQLVIMLEGLQRTSATGRFYIGLQSDASGVFTHVNGSSVAGSFRNFASVADATLPSACVLYQNGLWLSTTSCQERNDYICHIGPVRRSLNSSPAAPICGRRQPRGVLGRDSYRRHQLPFREQEYAYTLHGRAQFGEFTWQAAIWVRPDVGSAHQFTCSGALVDRAWVISSANCIRNINVTNVTITLGDWNLDIEANEPILPAITRQVSEIRISPGRLTYGQYGPQVEPGHLAMLRLSTPLTSAELELPHVTPACLPDPSVVHHLQQLRCVATGWRTASRIPSYTFSTPQHPHYSTSSTKEDPQKDILRKLEAGVTLDDHCQELGHIGDISQKVQQHQKQFRHQRPDYGRPDYGVPFFGGGGFYQPQAPHHHHAPTYPYQRSSAVEHDIRQVYPNVQGRDFGGGFPFHGPPHYQRDPFPPAYGPVAHPFRRVCLRDPRCIPDTGAVLACSLPPPLPHPTFHHHHPQHLPPLTAYSSANTHDEDEPEEQIVQTDLMEEEEISADDEEPVREGTFVLSRSFHPPKSKREAPVTTSTTTETPSSTAASKDTTVDTSSETATTADTAAADPKDETAEGRISSADPRLSLPHMILSALHHAPHGPLHHAPHPGAGGLHLSLQDPAEASTEHYDAYFVLGVAAPSTGDCFLRPMVFDDILSQLEFVQDTINN